MPQRVREVMNPDPVTVLATSSVRDAAIRMRDEDVGAVIVVAADDELLGIVTDRDITIRAAVDGHYPAEMTVGDLCSTDIVTLAPSDTVEDAVRRMREAGVRRLPVLEGGRPVGLVSLGDLAIELDPGSALGDISSQPPDA